ncbi:MAG: hypothetical protein NVV82_22790 [Sporocytophaga sp.]|nr:hypothetical protein [Sporocytophaga sp.]
MKIKSYHIFEKGVTIYLTNNTSHYIQFNQLSGKIICRKKGNTILGVDHTGIYFGKDSSGVEWVIHNHIMNKKTVAEPIYNFSNGQEVYEYQEVKPTNNWRTIIEEGLKFIIAGEPYTALFNNCQHVVTKAATTKSYSPDLTKIGGTVMLAGSTALLSKSKTVRKIGYATMFIGGGIALYNALNR